MRFGGEGTQRATGLVIDATGGLVLTGWFRGEIDFGNQTLIAHGDSMDGFVARLDAAGEPIWAQRVGGAGDQRPAGVVLAPDGDLWIGGDFRAAPLAIGDDQLAPAGHGDLFVARLDPAGAPRWARKLGGDGDDGMVSMSASADGELSVLGYFGDDAEVDGELVPALGPHNPFALSLDATGAATRLVRFGDGSWSQAGQDVLATPGGPVIAGAFTGTLTIDAQVMASAGAASDAFVARAGDGGWLRAFRSADPATPATAVALGGHAGGGILVTGERSGAVWTALLTP
jgi:hypothetical protein